MNKKSSTDFLGDLSTYTLDLALGSPQVTADDQIKIYVPLKNFPQKMCNYAMALFFQALIIPYLLGH